MSRIKLSDSIGSSVAKMAEGNPGAVTVMAQMLQRGEEIDPDSFLGGVAKVLSLDTHGIYGPRIWMLYKDVCGEDIEKTMGLLRACQLGFLAEDALNVAIDNDGKGIDVDALMKQVKERLPRFGAKL
jgi:hypothetical protein